MGNEEEAPDVFSASSFVDFYEVLLKRILVMSVLP